MRITYDMNDKKQSQEIENYYWFKYELKVLKFDLLRNSYIKELIRTSKTRNLTESEEILLNKIIKECHNTDDFERFKKKYTQLNNKCKISKIEFLRDLSNGINWFIINTYNHDLKWLFIDN